MTLFKRPFALRNLSWSKKIRIFFLNTELKNCLSGPVHTRENITRLFRKTAFLEKHGFCKNTDLVKHRFGKNTDLSKNIL